MLLTLPVRMRSLLVSRMFLVYGYMLPGGIICVLPGVMMGLLIDLRRPYLNWTHPQQAMNQNIHVLISMGSSFVYLAVLGGVGFLGMTMGLPSLVVGIIILAVSTICFLILRTPLRKAADTCYGPS